MSENTIIKKEIIFSNYLDLEEPETKDPYRKSLLEKENQREEEINEFETDKIFFDKLSDDLKMIRLRGGKDKDKQRDELLNFIC